MRAEETKLLVDVQEAGQSIRQRCAGQTFEQYADDRWFRREVDRVKEIKTSLENAILNRGRRLYG